jgi:hypothetical protein
VAIDLYYGSADARVAGEELEPAGMAIPGDLLGYLARLPEPYLVEALADLDPFDLHRWCGDEVAAVERGVDACEEGLREAFARPERLPFELEPPAFTGEFDYRPQPLGRAGVLRFLHHLRATLATARERGVCLYAVGD